MLSYSIVDKLHYSTTHMNFNEEDKKLISPEQLYLRRQMKLKNGVI